MSEQSLNMENRIYVLHSTRTLSNCDLRSLHYSSSRAINLPRTAMLHRSNTLFLCQIVESVRLFFYIQSVIIISSETGGEQV